MTHKCINIFCGGPLSDILAKSGGYSRIICYLASDIKDLVNTDAPFRPRKNNSVDEAEQLTNNQIFCQ